MHYYNAYRLLTVSRHRKRSPTLSHLPPRAVIPKRRWWDLNPHPQSWETELFSLKLQRQEGRSPTNLIRTMIVVLWRLALSSALADLSGAAATATAVAMCNLAGSSACRALLRAGVASATAVSACHINHQPLSRSISQKIESLSVNERPCGAS